MQCPSCGASITQDNERAVLFCPYCGASIPQEKSDLDKILEHDKYTKELEEKVRQRKEYEKRTAQKEEERSRNRLVIVLICIFVLLLGILSYSSNAPQRKLENQVKKVQQLIAQGEYDKALIEAQSIRKDKSGLFDSEPAFWDQQRNDLIKLIEEKKNEGQ